MKRTEKEISNEHPFAKKVEPSNIKVANLSDKMSIKDINKYIKRYQSGEGVIDIIPPGLTIKELKQLENLAKKRS
tara:strand:- start:943 stop:1167 length:225 start_codon:yes stop_codon:yes gene_type:complete